MNTVYFAIGTTSWIFDMLLCHHVVEFSDNQLPGVLRGMTPHVAWHFAAGLGGYCMPLSLMAARCEILGIPFRVNWLLGVMPLFSPELKKISPKTA